MNHLERNEAISAGVWLLFALIAGFTAQAIIGVWS